MKELDESFQQTVSRAVAPFKADEAPEKPNMDVSRHFLALCLRNLPLPGIHLTKQDQNRTFRTRLVSFWLISNAALAISIQTLSGMDNTKELVEACLPDSFNKEINGTCIEKAIAFDQTRLQDRQQEYFKYLLWATFGLSAVRFLGVSHSLYDTGLWEDTGCVHGWDRRW